ncbi:MAG TPA: alkaline phosphatase family protein [Thermoanaerobaculia bacterium]
MTDVESLRSQLRDRGYLSHGIERWFALDPWSSRAFWAELLTVAAKAAVLIALFGSLPCAAVMLARNHPLTAVETLELFALYALAWFAIGFVVVLAVALLLKIRPEITIDTSRGLLAISIATSIVLIVPLAAWWYEFDALPSAVELAVGSVLAAIFFVVATIVASAALLSFTIYELQRIPAIHQKPRGGPLSIAAAILVALLFVPVYATPERHAGSPQQVVTVPAQRHVALIGVDGLSDDILRSRPDLAREFTIVQPVRSISGSSTTERWASAGTGVPASLHGVRAVEGVRLAGGPHILQSVSRADLALRAVATRQPLPPTIRRRDYVWEIFAGRGVTSLSVNWWTTSDARIGALTSIGQETIFGTAKKDALAIDSGAAQRFLREAGATHPQFATIYLPALDVILNRVAAEPSARLAMSIRALDGALALVRALRQRGYDVVLVGMPGESQSGRAVVASSINLSAASSPFDVAPTLCSLMGFPASSEMPGRSLTGETGPRIASYGSRTQSDASPKLNQEYYDSLKSLGYIR